MEDINEVRKTISNKYSSACNKISHKINQGIVRHFSNSITKSLYLDLVYRGNDKVNFGHRMTDKDLILITDAAEPYVNVKHN